MATTMDEAKAAAGEAIGRIEALLGRANGRRRERTLGLGDVLGRVRAVAEGRPWSAIHGGRVANAYRYAAYTTACVAARVDGRIYVGIAEAGAKAASPGRAWPELQPWGEDGPRGDAAAKFRAWVKIAGTEHGDVIALDGPDVDAILRRLDGEFGED